VLAELKRTLVNVVDEDKLKRKLEIVHPVLPPDKQSRYQLYVTPNDAAVTSLAVRVNGARDAYELAVQWVWVSDQTLTGDPETWLTPHEFLVDTPTYTDNPARPNVASDCEEQAYTLVSLLRAEGIKADDVRVVLGKVDFAGEQGGHAWVELMDDGEWLPLDPSSGSYWDDDEKMLVQRDDTPFKYFSRHDYPQLEAWAYYNDIYYLDPRDGSGNAPVSWRAQRLSPANLPSD
jgi:transglutaminase-like putative cysteine protease